MTVYDSNGDRVEPEDVLDREELEAYYRHPNRTTRKFRSPHRSDEERKEDAEYAGSEPPSP